MNFSIVFDSYFPAWGQFPPFIRKAGSNSTRVTEHADGTHKAVRLCLLHTAGGVCYYSVEELFDDDFVLALRIPRSKSLCDQV